LFTTVHQAYRHDLARSRPCRSLVFSNRPPIHTRCRLGSALSRLAATVFLVIPTYFWDSTYCRSTPNNLTPAQYPRKPSASPRTRCLSAVFRFPRFPSRTWRTPMPRHKRQRPSWLPHCVPYKDGRYLGLARQTLLAWTSAVLALAFFLMTVAYATEKSRFSAVKFVHSSRSNTILVLRVLSEAAGVFLGGAIHSTFEVVQWVLISRPEGIRLPQYLALQSSTSPLGLLVLALGQGLPASQWPMKPRVLSLLRLIAELAVPVLGVLIMSMSCSNVEVMRELTLNR
jgi:hypothetical protein